MGDNLVPVEQPRGTVVFTRKVGLPNYGSAEAMVSIQFPVSFEDENATVAAANDAAFQAKTVVYSQLGIKAEYDEGILREVIEGTFGPTTVVQGNGDGGASQTHQQSSAPTSVPAASSSSGDGPRCPKCNGDMYDNRTSKRSPRQPDYRCKNYKPENGGCEGVIWPPKGGN